MRQKLKSKKINRFFKSFFVLAGFLVVAGFLFVFKTNVVFAACTDQGLTGGVWNFFCDATSLKLEPSKTRFKIGETVDFTVTLNNNLGLNSNIFPFDPLKDQKTFEISADGYILVPKQVPAGFGGVYKESRLISGPAFPKANSYKMRAAVIFYTTFGSSEGNNAWELLSPEISVQVDPADNTGAPSLKIQESSHGLTPGSQDTVLSSFNLVYSDGGIGKQADQILYYCDFNGDEAVGFKTLLGFFSTNAPSFNCSYPKDPKTYTVFAKVLDSSKQTLASSDQIKVEVTGNEKNAGAVNVNGNVSPVTGLVDLINRILGVILALLESIVYVIFNLLVAPIIEAMLSIHPYTDAFVAVIYPGWIVVRNLSNIIFIVALIAIGVATLLRLESYQYKHLLVQLVLAALLINFSLVIGQAVLGVADTVQSQFLPNNAAVIRSLARDLMFNFKEQLFTTDIINNGTFAVTIQSLVWLAVSLGSLMVFAAIAAYLVIRIVMLWILLMISPIAYVAGVLPSTAQYRGEWWKTFLKYAFFTPIMAFFLNMTVIISNTYKTNPILRSVTDKDFGGGVSGDLASFVFHVASSLLLLVFLLVSLMVAEKAGIYGASWISEKAKWGMFLPFKLAAGGVKLAAGFGAEKVHQKYHVQLNPYKWVEGFQKSRELNRAARERQGMLGAAGKSVLANPASFFQRYWDLGNIGKALTGKNKQGKRLLALAKQEDADAQELEEQMKKLEKDAVVLQQEAGLLEDGNPDKAKKLAEAKKKQEEAERIREKEFEPLRALSRQHDIQGRELAYADDYLTQEAARAGVHEEKGKIHAETWQELVSLARGALSEKKPDRFMGIYEKLAETFNENEITTHFQYPEDFDGADGVRHYKGAFFNDSAEGMDDFQKLVLQKQLGMSPEAGAFFSADIADICEKAGHRNKMRAYDHAFGEIRLKPRKERIAEVTAEKGKMPFGKKYREGNRLEGHMELPSLDFDKNDIRVPVTLEETINDVINSQEGIRFAAQRGELITSTAKALMFSGNQARLRLLADQKLTDPTPREMKDYRGNVIERINADGTVQDKFTEREEFEYTLEAAQEYGEKKWREGEMQKFEVELQKLLTDPRANGGKKPVKDPKTGNLGAIPGWLVQEYEDSGYLKKVGDSYQLDTSVKRPDPNVKYVLKGQFDNRTAPPAATPRPAAPSATTPPAPAGPTLYDAYNRPINRP